MPRRLALLALIGCLGCTMKESVVGKWHSVVSARGIEMENILEINPDHTYVGTITRNGLGFVEKGTWETKGDQYTWTSASIDPTGPVPNGRENRVEPAMAKLRQLVGHQTTSKFQFEGDDVLVVTGGDGTVNRMTRVK